MSLTHRQRDLLNFIISYQVSHEGHSPTYEECRKGLNVSSRANVNRMMVGLKERGYIDFDKGKHGIRLLRSTGSDIDQFNIAMKKSREAMNSPSAAPIASSLGDNFVPFERVCELAESGASTK